MENIIKTIKNFEDYTITNKGIIKNQYGTEIKGYVEKNGYIRITLYRDGERHMFYKHQLIVRNFLCEYKGVEVNHKDFNKKNNDIENLELVTRKENMKHYWDFKRQQKKEEVV